MEWRVLAVVVGMFAAGCREAHASAPAGDAMALTPDAASSVVADDPGEDEDEDAGPQPESWSDPLMIARLAADCRAEMSPNGRAGPRWCEVPYEQNCNFSRSACEDAQSRCENACTSDCDRCSSHCTDACVSCKARCSDDACRLACATACGACHDACVTTIDHCATGDCALRMQACVAGSAARWPHYPCARECAAYEACTEKPGGPDRYDRCARRHRHRCPADLFTACMSGEYTEYGH